jgi:hypothetical protein
LSDIGHYFQGKENSTCTKFLKSGLNAVVFLIITNLCVSNNLSSVIYVGEMESVKKIRFSK